MPQVTIVKEKTKEIVGLDALNIPAGKIVRVLPNSTANREEILIKTSFKEVPFVTIDTGTAWGKSLENYFFEILPIQNIILESF